MADTYNVFISWSGERSERVAAALYDWLPKVLQAARPWMSKEDIEKGSRGLEEIGKALEAMSVGIICLTPENAERPWIHFEAGALSKTMGDKTRVCPYLFGGLRGEQVRLPLGIFQATRAEKEETRKMVLAVNRAIGLVSEQSVGTWFERAWPELEGKLREIPVAKAAAPPSDEKKMVAEMLELAQVGANNDAKLREEVRELREVLERVAGPGFVFPSGGLGLGNRATVARGGFGNPIFYGEPPYSATGGGFGRLGTLTAQERAARARRIAELRKELEQEEGDEQAKEEQQKEERGPMHAPGKRAGEQGKTGDEKK